MKPFNRRREQLVSLKDWNDKCLKPTSTPKDWNGIACPLCGEELYDSSPEMIMTSSPAQTEIKCNKCLYTGRRYLPR